MAEEAAGWKCGKCGEEVEAEFEVCWNCGTSKEGVEDPDFRREEPTPPRRLGPIPAGMILATTQLLEGRPVAEYLGVVAGQAVVAGNVFGDILAGVTDMVGGRAGTHESQLMEARESALREMARAAAEKGADAVLGIDFGYASVRGTMLLVACSGTAVRLGPSPPGG